MALIEIKNLTLEIDTAEGWVKALDKISLKIEKHEIRALVGESGSGKSLIVKAIVGAIPSHWRITADKMVWKDQDMLSMPSAERRTLMREDIAVIFQDPIASLDPSATLGEQLTETIPEYLLDKGWFWQRNAQRKKIANELLANVGIENRDYIMRSYAHHISDDICQKYMLAMALVSRPQLLIADDPTRGMEAATKLKMLALLSELNRTQNLSILFVSHDLLAISRMAQSMTVLYCGQTVESGRTDQLRKRPLHPYTKALMDTAPSFQKELQTKTDLVALDGTIPTLQHLPIGCRLGPRCPRAQKECVKTPSSRHIQEHTYSCHFPMHWNKP